MTEDLLERLRAAASPEAYLDQGETIDRALPDYLAAQLEDRGLNRSELARRSGVNGTFVYDIFKSKSLPGRDNAIMLAFGLDCSVVETQRLFSNHTGAGRALLPIWTLFRCQSAQEIVRYRAAWSFASAC